MGGVSTGWRAALLLCACIGCVSSSSTECPWGATCPLGTICHDASQTCVSKAQETACKDLSDGDTCSFTGAPPGVYACTGGVCLATPFCGDGSLGTGEDCDCGRDPSHLPDGCTGVNSDTLADRCRVNCRQHRCGDGVLDSDEGCDDGNVTSGDGCSAECVRDGCGDGVRVSPEDCEGSDLGGASCGDLGYYSGTLACSSFCRFQTSGCIGRCGDGAIAQGQEECEAGNVGTTTCQKLGYSSGTLACLPTGCRFDRSTCSGYCGDGNVAGVEQCDGSVGAATCQSLGLHAGTLSCSPLCAYDTSQCAGFCGDGIINGGEQCDGSALASATCVSRGFQSGTLACSPNCTFDHLGCSAGLCSTVDVGGNVSVADDDAACGSTIDCAGWYQLTGDQTPTGTAQCWAHQSFTTHRCEAANDCKDADTADCSSQPLLGSPQVTCGVCKYVAGCTGSTAGSCTAYGAGTRTTLCHECNGTGSEQLAADDATCGLVSCSGRYTATGTAGVLTTEQCFAHQDLTYLRCTASATCKVSNSTDCDSQPLQASAQATCGVCKHLRSGTCTATTAGICDSYADNTLTQGSCGIGACQVFAHCVNGADVCVPGTPAADDDPDASFVDANCDGIDGNVSQGIFVAVDGNDADLGTMAAPKRTIQGGIDAASSGMDVYVSGGIYTGTITLKSGVNVYGGFDRSSNWARTTFRPSIVAGGATASMGVHRVTVIASSISAATRIENFVIYGDIDQQAGGNSYAVYVSGATGVLTIRNNTIFAGRGGPGGVGATGGDGSSGPVGTGRNPDTTLPDSAYDSKAGTGTLCDVTDNRAPTNAGTQTCGGLSVSGGNGGGTHCRPVYNTRTSGDSGASGFANGVASATGGFGGYDAVWFLNGASAFCAISKVPNSGGDGAAGATGVHGGGVAGCSANNGSVVSNHWVGFAGVAGNPGTSGGGGAGGGGGGGGECDTTGKSGTGTLGCQDSHDHLGAIGGGGGAGGCGGSAGGKGTAGGGSFAVFINGGTAPVITNNSITLGDGGNGGDGGRGGGGGRGGRAGLGGRGNLQCSYAAGRGGDGGDGGNGSGGGGGCGGISVGVLTYNVAGTAYCGLPAANTFTGGAAGAGGAGGSSLTNAGGPGIAGAVSNCLAL